MPALQPCCNWDDEQSSYVYPSKEHLRHYRIIITTLVTAGRSEELGLSPAPVAGGPRAALQPGCEGSPSGIQWGGVGGGQAAGRESLLCGRMRMKGRRGRMARWGRMLRQPHSTSPPGWCQPTSPLGFSPTSSLMSVAMR